jgi:hypothetical protein
MVACGSFGEAAPDAVLPGADGGLDTGLSDAPSGGDSGKIVPPPVGPRVCGVGSPFGAPREIVSAGPRVESARFSVDLKTVYLSTCSSGVSKTSCDLFTAAVSGDAIGVPTLHPLSLDGVYDSNLMLSPDGTVAVFASHRSAASDEIYTAVLVPLGSSAVPTPLALPVAPDGTANAYANEPYLLRDGKTMYFSASGGGGGDWDIYRAVGAPPGYDLSNAAIVNSDVNGDLTDVAPVVTEDEEEIFFATDRSGGLFDIWTATREPAAERGSFGVPIVLAASIDTAEVEYPTWISPDACTLYFIRKASTGVAGGALWAVSRTK